MTLLPCHLGSACTGADVLYVPLAKYLHRKEFLTCAAHRVASWIRAATSFNSFDDHDVRGLDSDDESVDFHEVGDEQQNQRRPNGGKIVKVALKL